VYAATQHLHDELASLRNRARLLEVSLRALHNPRTGYNHPILAQGRDSDEEDDEDNDNLEADGLSNTFGGLTVAEDGTARFFGNVTSTMGASPPPTQDSPIILDPILKRCIRCFPHRPPPGTRERAVLVLSHHLPEYAQARHLSESFFEHFSGMMPGISRTHLFVELLPSVYGHAHGSTSAAHEIDQEAPGSPRALALVFSLLALGALVDTSIPQRVVAAEHFGQLCVAALGAGSIFDSPTFVSACALFYRSIFELLLQKGVGDTGRSYMNLAFQVAIQVSYIQILLLAAGSREHLDRSS
jgi:hypothetical protein